MARTDTQVAIRVRPELHKQLKENAAKEERSMNYLINKAIEQFLENRVRKHETIRQQKSPTLAGDGLN